MTKKGAPTDALARTRTRNGQFTRTLETAERDAQAARLRAQGHSLAEIAETLGYAGTPGATAAIKRAVAAAVQPAGEELVTARLVELDAMRRAAWQVVQEPGYATSPRGDLVLGPDMRPIPDQAVRLTALNTLVKVSESERRLLGIDARDGLREREVRVREAELTLSVRALEIAARLLGMDVDSAHVSAVIEGAIVQAESEMKALPPA